MREGREAKGERGASPAKVKRGEAGRGEAADWPIQTTPRCHVTRFLKLDWLEKAQAEVSRDSWSAI